MTLSKIVFAAGLLAIVAPTASFASTSSPYDRCQTPFRICSVHANQVGVATTVYGELESRGTNSAQEPSLTPDGSQPTTKVIVANTAPEKAGHDMDTF